MTTLTVELCGLGGLDAPAPATSTPEAEECDQETSAAHDSETKTAENRLHSHLASTAAENRLRWHLATTAEAADVM